MSEAIGTCNALADCAFSTWQEIRHRDDLADKVGMGADGTPTSRADRLVEERMLRVAADLGVSVVSEEAGHVAGETELVAVVDPVDGTRNAGRGVPFFCTSIAVGTEGLDSLQAGVVRNLVTGDRYSAEADRGARFNGEPMRVRPFDPDEVVVAMIADESKGGRWPGGSRVHLRDLGSAALEMCLVATGGLDGFFVREPWLRIVDIAAGVLIVREAGGVVLDPERRQDLQAGLDLSVRTGVLAARPEAVEAMQ